MREGNRQIECMFKLVITFNKFKIGGEFVKINRY